MAQHNQIICNKLEIGGNGKKVYKNMIKLSRSKLLGLLFQLKQLKIKSNLHSIPLWKCGIKLVFWKHCVF